MTEKLPSHGAGKTAPIRWPCSVCGRVIRQSLDVIYGTNAERTGPAVRINLPHCCGREMLAGEPHEDGKST